MVKFYSSAKKKKMENQTHYNPTMIRKMSKQNPARSYYFEQEIYSSTKHNLKE